MKDGSAWDILHRRAKTLEARLETRVQRYSSLAQKINASLMCDEENPLTGGSEEQSLASEIERDLHELSECINGMRGSVAKDGGALAGSGHQEVLIKRYHEIHFDYSTEFKNTSATVHRKRESMELFQSSKNLHMDEQDSSVAKLLRERSSIQASMKSINDVISQAFETKNALLGQRNSLTGSASGLTGLAANVPTFNRLIDGIQRKKTRESIIVAVVIGLLACFLIWWVFLK
jgi:Golgi SNAP receptor complex protein 1